MHLLVPRSRSSAKVKVKYKGYTSQKMAISGTFLFHKHILLEIKSQYKDYFSIYTDGWKQGNKVGCTSVHKQETAKIRLPDHSSIFSQKL